MNATNLLDQVMKKASASTDYKLAQVLDIPTQKISAIRKGKASPDAYECAKIAIALGIDPLEVIAKIEGESARTEKKREFWKTFRSSGNRAILEFLLCATLIFSGHAFVDGASSVRAVFRRWKSSYNVYYVK